ncbi:MAG: universal stress protein [Longimicrobiales bacterium]|nr:universal stress protein [Longimicrobiales bacterium]
MSRTVLVATDGSPAALGALRFAKALADQEDREVQLLGVVEPVPVFDAGFMVALPEVELYESRREALREEISRQAAAITGSPTFWPISVQAGVPASRIVKLAEERGAEAILMGIGGHGPMDKVFGTETALQVMRVSHIPVLAVPESFQKLPRSAVMGVDFSLFSQRAAQAAISLLATPWDVHLVHVLSGLEFLPTLSEDWRENYEEEIANRLVDLTVSFQTPDGCKTHVHVLEGEPSHELLAFADAKGVELLVAGSHGHSFVGRLLMGSVSTRLIRSAKVPVLVVPPLERSEEILAQKDSLTELRSWAKELNDFTKANAGRRTTLEVDEPELGLQECGRNFPLLGVDYDPKMDRVDIMLGRSGTVEGHLTHSIPAPQDIRITRGEGGRAEALHIQCRSGKVILRIHRD